MSDNNVFEGHVLPRRKEGDVEVINLALFNPDGSPFALPAVYVPPEHGDWVDVTNGQMSNGWTNQGAGGGFRYRKRGDGIVELRGHIGPGAEGLVYDFPSGFAPIDLRDSFLGFTPYCHDDKQALFAIQEDGTFICTFLPSGGNPAYINVASISWPTN